MMVMGPGGYRFGDYWKLGLPMLVWFVVGRRAAGAADLALLTSALSFPNAHSWRTTHAHTT